MTLITSEIIHQKESPEYIIHLGAQLVTKNRLEKAVASYLSKLDRTLIGRKELKLFKSNLIEDIAHINLQYKSGKRIFVSFFPLPKGDFWLSGAHFSNFHIYQINQEISRL